MITVITPTLNAAETLQRCIVSVREQGADVEHLFIDGGSTDGTREMLGTFVDAPGSNIYEAQNIGIRAAHGEWLYFLGADDRVLPGALAELEDRLCGVSESWIQVLIRVGDTHLPRYARQQQAYLYRRTLYSQYSLYEADVGLYADVRFNLRLSSAKERLLRIPVVLSRFEVKN